MHASAATSPGSSLLPALLVVLCLLYPPSGCACFRLGKHGGNASTITSTSGGAGSSPSSSPAKWKTPQWGKMFAEALGQTGNTNDGSHTSMECNAADELMRKRGPDNYRKALEEYKALLEKEPDNASLKLKLANASVSLLRSVTNANAVLIDGISDSEANRKLWKQYAFTAYDLLKDLHKSQPDNPQIHVLMTEAYTYRTSSKGILKAAVTGDGLTFMKLVNQIVKSHPTYDAGVPFIFRGAFLLAAPWPLRDVPKAVEAFQAACKIEPRSLRNNYFLGVSQFHAGAWKEAAEAFTRAVGGEVESVAATEKDVAEFLKRESRRSLDVTKGKIAATKM